VRRDQNGTANVTAIGPSNHWPGALRVKSMDTAVEPTRCLNLSVNVHALELLGRLKSFLQSAVFSVERELAAAMDAFEGPEPFPPLMTDLRVRARSTGLWNLFLPGEAGPGLTNVEYAHICELLGRTEWAPTVVNCHFPDTGNARYCWITVRPPSSSAGCGRCWTAISAVASR
jgi:hypothetical protein